DAALELVPKSAPMLARRAQILARLRRFEESKSALDQAKVASESDEVELSLAWYYYSQGNAEEAVNRLRSVARSLDQRDESPVARYARTWSEAIGENLAMEVWEDHFNRVASGRDLLRGWKEHAPASGVSINLLQNRVAFAGTQRQTGTPSSIIQQRSAKAFVSFEAALSCRPRDEYTAGVAALRFTGRRGEQNPFVDPFSDAVATDGLLVAKTPEGRIAYRLIERNELGRWQSIEGLRWPDPQDGKPQAQNLGLAIEDAKKGTWRILFGGQPVGEPIEVKGLGRSSRDLQLWVFTQAEIDKRIDLGVDDVRIVTRND
ncbi:MAG: hypothetical protein KDB53_02080, partial [Planctomycetes bacterium]|nr:hypothetical protein [Planctomycetota bacterium]